jgi:hypothetical protein
VVYDNGASRLHVDPYAVATAMRGIDVVPVIVPTDPDISPEFLPTRSGPKKKMTETANTNISAIGVLLTDFGDKPLLCVYHNRHARHPIQPDSLRGAHLQHFPWRADATNSLNAWGKA